ncbi:MAG: protease modulator HflC, partial [Azoarcus sp.]|nr:protease modulator HflC [Azoarcus sp.]
QYAIVFQFGEVKRVIKEPGLEFKVPLIQNVRFFDRRTQTMDRLEMGQLEQMRFITSEKQNVVVDYFVKWRISDPQIYFQSLGDAVGGQSPAARRIYQVVDAGLREEFGKRKVHDVISPQRDAIMSQMSKRANDDVKRVGVEIIDVRLKRVEYPEEVSKNVYDRMRAERERVANERRSRGAAESERIRADADRQREVIVAEANKDALQIKGEGDAKAAATYAEAFKADPEFYSFYRSLEAYRNSFGSKEDFIVIAPDSDFFKYLKTPQGKR